MPSPYSNSNVSNIPVMFWGCFKIYLHKYQQTQGFLAFSPFPPNSETPVVSTPTFLKWQSSKKTTIKKLAFLGSQDRELWGASAVDIPLLSATTWATFWAALSASYCFMPPSCVIVLIKARLELTLFNGHFSGHRSKMMKYICISYVV